MAGRDPEKVAALAAQARRIMAVFGEGGYAQFQPEVIQPAELFFERSGEEIRRRTYVFNDLGGEELCLRPDLTIPTCRLHLDTAEDPSAPVRYCYLGSAFRYQPGGETAESPREFQQAGIENFGAEDREAAEAEVFALAVEAVRAAGLSSFHVRLGDLGLFRALIKAIDMPKRWRRRLRAHFWRREGFRALLQVLEGKAEDPAMGGHRDLLKRLSGLKLKQAVEVIEGELAVKDIPLVGGRGIHEIAERLLSQAGDLEAAPLPGDIARLIEDYAAVLAGPRAAVDAISGLARKAGLDLDAALTRVTRRLDLIEASGFDLADARFQAVFGRNLEYYTGAVFQFERPEWGHAGRIGGGGRYDTLLKAIGARKKIPAVGCALHTERLLAAIAAGGTP